MKYEGLVVALIMLSSCGTQKNTDKVSQSSVMSNTQDTIYLEKPDIFHKSKPEIASEIQEILIQNRETYDQFRNKLISLDLVCDTTSGVITSVTVDEDFGFSEYSARLVEYFESMPPVRCAVYPVTGKVSEYILLIGWRGNDLTFEIDYGYRDEPR